MSCNWWFFELHRILDWPQYRDKNSFLEVAVEVVATNLHSVLEYAILAGLWLANKVP